MTTINITAGELQAAQAEEDAEILRDEQISPLDIRKAAGEMGARIVWETGTGDGRLRGWEIVATGTRAIETNGDSIWEDADGFAEAWESRSIALEPAD